MVQPPADNEFVGVIEHDTESLHKLLTEGPGSSSSSDSSWGSHHPSQGCFMAETPEGHVESVSEEETTPEGNPDGRPKAETVGTHAPWPVMCTRGSSPMMGPSLTLLRLARTSPL